MTHVYKVGEKFSDIVGPERDEFLTDLWDIREETDDDILLDLEGVDHLGSLALAAIGKLHTWMNQNGRTLTVRCPNKQIHQLFTITGFTKVLNLVDTPDDDG